MNALIIRYTSRTLAYGLGMSGAFLAVVFPHDPALTLKAVLCLGAAAALLVSLDGVHIPAVIRAAIKSARKPRR